MTDLLSPMPAEPVDDLLDAPAPPAPQGLTYDDLGAGERAGFGPPPLTDTEAHALIDRLAGLEERKGRIKTNAERLLAEADSAVEWLMAQEGDRLREWTAGQLRGRARSVRTLLGVAGFRTQPARLRIEDEAEAIAWALEELPEAVTRKLELARLGKPAHYAVIDPETGEQRYQPPPGIEVVPESERFYVKPGTKPGAGEGSE